MFFEYFGLNPLLSGAGSKGSACNVGDINRSRFDLWVGKIPWRRAWQPTPKLLSGESHGQWSLAGYSPQGHTELDMTEELSTQCM